MVVEKKSQTNYENIIQDEIALDQNNSQLNGEEEM